jgi:hypothetical protein
MDEKDPVDLAGLLGYAKYPALNGHQPRIRRRRRELDSDFHRQRVTCLEDGERHDSAHHTFLLPPRGKVASGTDLLGQTWREAVTMDSGLAVTGNVASYDTSFGSSYRESHTDRRAAL